MRNKREVPNYPNGLSVEIERKFYTKKFIPTDLLLDQLNMSLERFKMIYQGRAKITVDEALIISETMGFSIYKIIKPSKQRVRIRKAVNKIDIDDFAAKFSRKVLSNG